MRQRGCSAVAAAAAGAAAAALVLGELRRVARRVLFAEHWHRLPRRHRRRHSRTRELPVRRRTRERLAPHGRREIHGQQQRPLQLRAEGAVERSPSPSRRPVRTTLRPVRRRGPPAAASAAASQFARLGRRAPRGPPLASLTRRPVHFWMCATLHIRFVLLS